MKAESVRIGIVGGYGHESVRWLPGAELAWAADGYDDKAIHNARLRGSDRTYRSLDELIGEFRPDIVYVGSVYGWNARLILHSLDHGIPIVSEKPLAVTREELELLRQRVGPGRPGVVAEFAMRWCHSFKRARQLIQEGAIGAPIHIQAQKSYKFGVSRPDFYRERALFGGIIPWVASHAIDFAAWTTGLRYHSVAAQHGNRCHPEYPEMEDFAAMQFEMSGGVPCVITADFLRPEGAPTHGDDRLRVTGDAGVIEVRGSDVFLTDGKGEKTWHDPSADPEERARELVSAALGCGHTITPEESLHITEAALAAREAADAHRSGRRSWVEISR